MATSDRAGKVGDNIIYTNVAVFKDHIQYAQKSFSHKQHPHKPNSYWEATHTQLLDSGASLLAAVFYCY